MSGTAIVRIGSRGSSVDVVQFDYGQRKYEHDGVETVVRESFQVGDEIVNVHAHAAAAVVHRPVCEHVVIDGKRFARAPKRPSRQETRQRVANGDAVPAQKHDKLCREIGFGRQRFVVDFDARVLRRVRRKMIQKSFH